MPFGYGHVDGLGRAAQRAKKPQLGNIFTADAIGPMIEYGNLLSGGGWETLRSANWLDKRDRQSFIDAWIGPDESWTKSDGSCGFIRAGSIASDTALNSFKIDAHKSALAAGFSSASPPLIAAMGELIENVEEHSESLQSGLSAFLSRAGTFDFVVADQGIGVLASLRKCVDFATLPDEGTALSKMVESGVSRFGDDKGHGNGFRPLFETLADMTGQLRFRSGDQALSLEGNFGDRIARRLAQKPTISGFFAAVICRT